MSKAALADFVALHRIYLTRSLFFIFGCVGIWWGVAVLPVFWHQNSAERVAQRVIAGDSFKPEVLSEQTAALARSEKVDFCRPAALQSAAIIQLRIAERASGGSLKNTGQLNLLDSAVRRSLSCAPADSFLWLILFATQNAKEGYKPENLKFLRMSYALGPNEGWIIERRTPFVIGGLELLPADMAAKATDEFIRLLNEGRFYRRAVDIFCKTTAPRRDAILPKTATLSLALRKSFARSIYDCGLDLQVPGVKVDSPKRPW